MPNIKNATLQEVSDVLEQSECQSQVDLGDVVLVCCRHAVMGDLITVSSASGNCAIINP